MGGGKFGGKILSPLVNFVEDRANSKKNVILGFWLVARELINRRAQQVWEFLATEHREVLGEAKDFQEMGEGIRGEECVQSDVVEAEGREEPGEGAQDLLVREEGIGKVLEKGSLEPHLLQGVQ